MCKLIYNILLYKNLFEIVLLFYEEKYSCTTFKNLNIPT